MLRTVSLLVEPSLTFPHGRTTIWLTHSAVPSVRLPKETPCRRRNIDPGQSPAFHAAVTRTGRITNGRLGLWEYAQIAAPAPIAAFLAQQGSVPAIQIAYGGRKASTQLCLGGQWPR